ncbi:MAG TPA: hypothetical protein VFS43_13395 [Polyangiaceae bacterium]|nr:hypothetical protein [Polyangiaceae bacterium]
MNHIPPFSARWIDVTDANGCSPSVGFIGVVELKLPWKFGLLVGRCRNGRTYSAWAEPHGPLTMPLDSAEA